MIMTNGKNGFRIYNNGSLLKEPYHYSYQEPDLSLVNQNDIILGKQPSANCPEEIPLNGMIDDFRLYNTSITDEEALALYSLSTKYTGVECFSNLNRTNANISSRYYFIDILVKTDCLYPFSLLAYSSSKDKERMIPIKVIEEKSKGTSNFTFLLTDAQISKLECEIDVKEEILHINILRNCSIFFELISNDYTVRKYPFYFLIEKNSYQTIDSNFLLVPTTEILSVKPELEKFSYMSISSFCQDDCINFPYQDTYFSRHGYIYFIVEKNRDPRRLSDPNSDSIPIIIQATVTIQVNQNNYFSPTNVTFDVLKEIKLISSPSSRDYDIEWKYSLFLENFLNHHYGHCELSLIFQFIKNEQNLTTETLNVSFNAYDEKRENSHFSISPLCQEEDENCVLNDTTQEIVYSKTGTIYFFFLNQGYSAYFPEIVKATGTIIKPAENVTFDVLEDIVLILSSSPKAMLQKGRWDYSLNLKHFTGKCELTVTLQVTDQNEQYQSSESYTEALKLTFDVYDDSEDKIPIDKQNSTIPTMNVLIDAEENTSKNTMVIIIVSVVVGIASLIFVAFIIKVYISKR